MAWESYNPIEKMHHLYYPIVKEDGVLIPTTDDVAWKHFKRLRWVYNKLELSETQERLDYGLVPTIPTQFPVVVKPVYNLWGGGIDACVAHNLEEYKAITTPGLFWSPYHFGEHYSVDFILLDGDIKEMFTFRGEKLQFGAFDYWELINDDDYLLELLAPWIETHMEGYTGCLNLEVIGEYIIEAHLRMGDIDKLGDSELMYSIWELYNKQEWNYKRNYETPETFYIAALFAQPNKKYSLDFKLFEYIMGEEIMFYQFDDPSGYFINPSHGNRVAVFCDTEFENVIWARNIAANMLKPDIDGRYLQPLEGYIELSI